MPEMGKNEADEKKRSGTARAVIGYRGQTEMGSL